MISPPQLHLLDLHPPYSKLSNPNPNSHHKSLVRTHIKSHEPKQALSLFHSHHPFAFPPLLKACAQLADLQAAQQLHALIVKYGQHDTFANTALINAYAECGRIGNARQVFDRMPERNTVTWNSMLAALLKCGRDISSVVQFFHDIPERNIVSWNTLLGGYVKANMLNEALLLFIQMQSLGVRPDESTLASLVTAVSDMGLLALGRRAHGYITRNRFSLDGALGVALITMYSRCGNIDAAYRVFASVQEKNIGHWTSIIGALANHGCTETSLQVFCEMLQLGIRPNYVTFIGVLNACRHAGLAEEGLKYFSLMKSFDIKPRIEHYGCLVDMLGRKGLVEEAMEIASNLPEDPGFVMWSGMLAACRNHGKVEIAEIVANKLIELRPEYGSPYLLLGDVYARAGRLEEFRRMRGLMDERRVVKVAGFSRIEVDGAVHEFVAGDQFHVDAGEIYEMLEEMKLNLRWESHDFVDQGQDRR